MTPLELGLAMPTFANELAESLRVDGRYDLAAQIAILPIVERCRCGILSQGGWHRVGCFRGANAQPSHLAGCFKSLKQLHSQKCLSQELLGLFAQVNSTQVQI